MESAHGLERSGDSSADYEVERPTGVLASWRGVAFEEFPADGNIRIVIAHTRGVQVGEYNKQLNLREYHIEKPQINFEEVFGSPAVQEELLKFAENPEDMTARGALERTLSAGKIIPGGLHDSILSDSAAVSSSYAGGFWMRIDKTVLVIDSRGVQVGDHSSQRNSFVYTISPEIDAFSLLAENPKIVKAMVDLVDPRRPKKTKDLYAEISGALEESVQEASVSHPNRGVKFEPPQPGEILRVDNVDGAVIGHVAKQTERVTVEVDRLRSAMAQLSTAAQDSKDFADQVQETKGKRAKLEIPTTDEHVTADQPRRYRSLRPRTSEEVMRSRLYNDFDRERRRGNRNGPFRSIGRK